MVSVGLGFCIGLSWSWLISALVLVFSLCFELPLLLSHFVPNWLIPQAPCLCVAVSLNGSADNPLTQLRIAAPLDSFAERLETVDHRSRRV